MTAGISGNAVAVYPVPPRLIEALTEDCEWGIHENWASVSLFHSITEQVADLAQTDYGCSSLCFGVNLEETLQKAGPDFG